MTYQVGDWIPLSEWRKLPRASGIYVIREVRSRKLYVGKSNQIRRRISAHNLNSKTSQYVLSRAVRQHGIDSFEVSVRRLADITVLNDLEMRYIARLHCMAPVGYNMTVGGEGFVGLAVSEETRAKMRKTMKLRGMPDELKEKTRIGYQEWLKTPEATKVLSRRVGSKWSDETKAKMSMSSTGIRWSEEAKQRQSERCLGRPISEKAKERIAITSKARWSTELGSKLLEARRRNKADRLVKEPKLVIFTENSFCGSYAATYEDAATYLGVTRPCITNWLKGIFKARVPVAIAEL